MRDVPGPAGAPPRPPRTPLFAGELQHLTNRDHGPVLLYLHHVDLHPSIASMNSPELLMSLWVRKEQTNVKHGTTSRNPTQLSDIVKRHYNLLIERTSMPAKNVSMEV